MGVGTESTARALRARLRELVAVSASADFIYRGGRYQVSADIQGAAISSLQARRAAG